MFWTKVKVFVCFGRHETMGVKIGVKSKKSFGNKLKENKVLNYRFSSFKDYLSEPHNISLDKFN